MARESTGSITVHHCWWMLLTLLNIRGRCTEPRKKNFGAPSVKIVKGSRNLVGPWVHWTFCHPFSFYIYNANELHFMTGLVAHAVLFTADSHTHFRVFKYSHSNREISDRQCSKLAQNCALSKAQSGYRRPKWKALCRLPSGRMPARVCCRVSMYQALWVRNTWTSPSWDD